MSKTNSTLTSARLRELFSYDPETGVFTRLVTISGRWLAGQAAGTVNKLGYRQIQIARKIHTEHRLAFLYMTGEWPADFVDHIDGDRSNNRWSNLRDVSQTINMQNRKGPQRDNALGILGVTRKDGRFRAQLKHDGVAIYLGKFDTPEEAHEAFLAKKRLLHEGNTL